MIAYVIANLIATCDCDVFALCDCESADCVIANRIAGGSDVLAPPPRDLSNCSKFLVVSRYREDVRWLSQLNDEELPHAVYNHVDGATSSSSSASSSSSSS